jgi:hypothetical protein
MHTKHIKQIGGKHAQCWEMSTMLENGHDVGRMVSAYQMDGIKSEALIKIAYIDKLKRKNYLYVGI